MLIVGGTSLAVYPAARTIDYYQGGRRLVSPNATPTPTTGADLIIREPIGRVFRAESGGARVSRRHSVARVSGGVSSFAPGAHSASAHATAPAHARASAHR